MPAPRNSTTTAARAGAQAKSLGLTLERAVAAYIEAWRTKGLQLWLVGAHSYGIGGGKARYTGLTPESRMVDLVGRYMGQMIAIDIKGTAEDHWSMTDSTLPEREQECLAQVDGGARYGFAGLLICTQATTRPQWELRRLLCGVQSGLYEDPDNPRRVALSGLDRVPDGLAYLLHGIRTPGVQPVGFRSERERAAARVRANGGRR